MVLLYKYHKIYKSIYGIQFARDVSDIIQTNINASQYCSILYIIDKKSDMMWNW